MIIASLLLNVVLVAWLYIVTEQRKIDLEIIESKNEVIEDLFSIIQENDFEFTTPYDEFLAYLDEEGTL
jgi:hypothetical protein